MKDEAAVSLGTKGGNATKKKGSDYFRKIGAKGNKKRWAKKVVEPK